MNGLNLPNPKMMDVAVPANMRQGLAQAEIARRGWAMTAAQAMDLLGDRDVAFVDLRERTEREKHGGIPGALHAPYTDLVENIRPGGMLHELATRDRAAAGVLLRLRRAQRHGGAGGAGCRAGHGLPHRRRDGGVAARRRAGRGGRVDGARQ